VLLLNECLLLLLISLSTQSGNFWIHPRIIRMDLKKGVKRCGLHSSGSGDGSVAGCCEHGNEPSGFIKGGEFLD
jgi:hypothetical protein